MDLYIILRVLLQLPVLWYSKTRIAFCGMLRGLSLFLSRFDISDPSVELGHFQYPLYIFCPTHCAHEPHRSARFR